MGFANGTITLNSPNSAYYSGQVISGNVSFPLDMPTTWSVITVTFTGEAHVQWQDTDGEKCSGREQYFNVTVPICGGNGLFTLSPGQHQYPFQYQIPFEVPGTFRDSIGSVQYCIQAAADSPTVCRETIQKAFTVVAPLDLNKNDDCKQPIELEFEQESSGCCVGSRGARIQFFAPATGYCPGQRIPVRVSVDNSSNVEVRRLLFELISVTGYRSQSPQSELVTPPVVLARVKRGPVLSKAKGQFLVEVPIPDMVAPNLYNCAIMGVEYSLRVTVKMTGCTKDESDEANICLGHIPLAGFEDNYEPPLKEHLPIGPIPTMPLQPPGPGQNAGDHQSTPNSQYPQAPPYMPYDQYPAQPPMADSMPSAPNLADQNLPYPQENVGSNAMSPAQQWNGDRYPQIGFAVGTTMDR